MNDEHITEETDDEIITTTSRSQSSSRSPITVIVGVLVVLIGLWLLGQILELLPGIMIFPLPIWAVIFGLAGALIAGSSRQGLVPGLLLMLVSGTYLIRYLGWMGEQSFHQIWLGTIVLVGLILILASGNKNKT